MQSTFKTEQLEKIIRKWLMFFIVMLVVSGITAIPVEKETRIALVFVNEDSMTGLWLQKTQEGLKETSARYPFLFYGYDWLAFAHVVLAIVFIGPYRDPVRNKWVVEFGAIACLLVIPFALVMGQLRGIPFWWRLVDCSFGIIGLLPMGICYNRINELEKLQKELAA
jgi:hypothetical protein